MKRLSLCVLAVFFAVWFIAVPQTAYAADVTATFADAALYAAVGDELTSQGIGHVDDASAKTITVSADDAASVKKLSLSNRNIKSTKGLEAFAGLEQIDLSHNLVSDISGLAGLNELVYLDLYDNAVHDFDALRDHTSLVHLNLGQNNEVAKGTLENMDVLSTLTGLEWLDFSQNYAPGVAEQLSGLISLEYLNLQSNDIEDVSALASLANMKSLVLSHNKICDISALFAMHKLEELSLVSNDLNRVVDSAATTNEGKYCNSFAGVFGADGESFVWPDLRCLDIFGNTNWGMRVFPETGKLFEHFEQDGYELGFRYDRIYQYAGYPYTDARLQETVEANGGYIAYDDFGTYCDGKRDDFDAMRNAHLYANAKGCEVRGTAGKTYHVFRLWDLNYITAYTNVDWQGADFVIHDEDIESKGARYVPILCLRPSPQGSTEATSAYRDIKTIKNPGWTVGKDTTALADELSSTLAELNAKENADGSAKYGSYYVQVFNDAKKQYIRYGTNANGGSRQWDGVRIGRDGAVLKDGNATIDGTVVGGGFQWDFDQVTEVLVTPIPSAQSHVRNGNFVQTVPRGKAEAPYGRGGGKPTYYTRDLQVRDCANVEVSNIKQTVGIPGQDGNITPGDNDELSGSYNGFFEIRACADVHVHDCLAWARKYEASGRSTYGLVMNTLVNVTLERFDNSNSWEQMLDGNRWGIMGNNHCKDIVFDTCTVNRIDAHEGFYNMTARNCKLGSWGFRLIGQGPLRIEGTEVHSGSFIMLRFDYGSTWDGQALIKNCTQYPCGTDSRGLMNASPTYEDLSHTAVHDFGYELHFPNLRVENFTVDYSETPENAKDEFYIVPNHTYNDMHLYPESYWPDEVSVDGIDFVNYEKTKGYEPAFRLTSTREGTIAGKVSGYSARNVTFEGHASHEAIGDGTALVRRDSQEMPLEITKDDLKNNSFEITLSENVERELAIEYTGSMPSVALMDNAWQGWTRIDAYDIGQDIGANVAYFSELAMGSKWEYRNAGNEDVGPAVRLRITTDGDTVVTRVVMLPRHAWLDWIVDKPATCDETGCEVRTCGTASSHIQTREIPALGHDWGPWENAGSEKHQRVCAHDATHVQVADHEWDAGAVTKAATADATGVRTFTCAVCKATRTETVPKLEAEREQGTGTDADAAAQADPLDSHGKDVVAFAAGARLEAAEAAIKAMSSDADPMGTTFAPLKLKSTKQKKNQVKLSWSKVAGAKRYAVYAGACGKGVRLARVAFSKGNSYSVKKAAGAKLKKGRYYKLMVIALDADDVVVASSKIVHVATRGGKAANPTKVKVKKAKLSLSVGKKAKLGAKQAGKGVKKHRALAYESSDATVVSVDKKGKLKARGRGVAYVYAYAQNGVCARTKVTVK